VTGAWRKDCPDLDGLLAHEDFVKRIARGLLGDEHLAEDAAQEAWLAALRRPPASDHAARAWLVTVARNFSYQTARARIRRIERERRVARHEAAEAAASDPALDGSTRRRIAETVLRLREPYREAVLLRFYAGLAPAAISDRLGVPVETVKTRLKRALSFLRARLEPA
jgi:RNA polymerase sigma factor (sigma-70 family)